eukprot:10165548-Alexandrium_andersonii.AAC.1
MICQRSAAFSEIQPHWSAEGRADGNVPAIMAQTEPFNTTGNNPYQGEFHGRAAKCGPANQKQAGCKTSAKRWWWLVANVRQHACALEHRHLLK